MRVITAAVGIAIVALLAVIANQFMHPVGKKTEQAAIVTTMPPGITFQQIGGGNPLAGGGKRVIILSDAKNMTLYTFDKDTQPGKSACAGDCAKAWPALAAPADAKDSGAWKAVAREDGSKQWSFRGKPLYTSAQDTKPGETKGNGVDGAWHMAANDPAAGLSFPDGITAREMLNAGGQVIADARKRTLYVFDGDEKAEKQACAANVSCVNHWMPLVAPEIANNVGDFTVIRRADGTKQWAYQGKPVYTYDQDIDDRDAAGRAVDPRFHVAYLEKYFTPAEVAIGINARGYDVLTTASGMTVYTRDRFGFNVGGYNLRGGQRGIPQIGKALALLGCNGDCLKTWPPVKAPADALPAGWWSVVSRPDGTKQWAYNGYALYAFSGDTKPGDARGQDDFDITIKLPPTPQNPIDAVSALYWRGVSP